MSIKDKNSLNIQLERLERYIFVLESIIRIIIDILVELDHNSRIIRHKINEYLTDLYGLINHVNIHGKDHRTIPRQKIPIKHYL